MTAYEHYNLPENYYFHIAPVEEDLVPVVMNSLSAARHLGLVVAEEVTVARIYDRKGEIYADEFGGVRNKAYGSKYDDVVIQMTVRIARPQECDGLIMLENVIKERKSAAAKAKLLAEIEDLKSAQHAAEMALQKKVDELSKMNVQD